MAYYYEGRDGASFTESVVHYREDCDELGEPIRPIAEATIEASEDIEMCPDCTPLDSASESDTDEPDGEEERSRESLIEDGRCPWCIEEGAEDPYKGEHVGQHASSAHPEEWDAYKND